MLNTDTDWSKQFPVMADWSAWLSEEDETGEIQMLRRNIEKGLPCGSAAFIAKLGEQMGRLLEYRPQGRPKRAGDDNKG